MIPIPAAIPVKHLVDRMVDILKATRVDPSKFRRPIGQLFANINKTIRDQSGSDPHAAGTLSDLINQVQEQLLLFAASQSSPGSQRKSKS